MSDMFDRDKALAIIEQRWRGHSTEAEMLDALAACVRPAPPQGVFLTREEAARAAEWGRMVEREWAASDSEDIALASRLEAAS